MGIFLLLLIFSPVRGIFEGSCPRKDPPAGVLVVSPGSELVLTCGGHVKVDGINFSLTGSSAGTNKRESSSNVTPATQNDIDNSAVSVNNDNSSAKNAVSEPGENRSLIYTDARYTDSPHIVRPTRATRSLKDEFNWTTEEMDVEDDHEEDGEGEGESRVTRGIKLRPEWKWNKMTVGKGNRDWGEITFEQSGSTLSLASVRPTDSGKYTCHHRGKERFGVKVMVAESPESPELYCYKKSPSSKLRCEGKVAIKHPTCYLLLNKSPKEKFRQVPCSYSIQHSLCWCALNRNDDEESTFHSVYMCVTSITANVTSRLQFFRPLDILKPDPPSNVAVRQEVGKERKLTVSWNLPTSWKIRDNYYKLIYEVKYNPVKPALGKEQVIPVEGQRYKAITDIFSGVEYLIQVRTKEEFDGHWSDWSTPVYASSWTKKPHPPSIVSVVEEEGQDTMMVTWSLSTNLKEQHNFSFIYEIKYWHVNFPYNEEVRQFEGKCSYTITDAMPNVEYMIQLRFKKEHAGQWSDWSVAFRARKITEKPHPPSIVSVVEEEGQDTMMVTWSLSTNLKEQHNFSFIYEIKYRPVNFSYNEEVRQFEGKCSYIITDAMPNAEYLIQLRFKKEHAGQWSDWSIPFHARKITVEPLMDDLAVTGPEDSGDFIDNYSGTETSPSNVEWVYHVVWIFALFILLSVILAIYTFRHKDRLISKFLNLYCTTYYGDSSQPLPAVPTAPEGMALVAFVPPKSNKERPPSDEKESEENEEQEILKERTEAMYFNNMSYFSIQRE